MVTFKCSGNKITDSVKIKLIPTNWVIFSDCCCPQNMTQLTGILCDLYHKQILVATLRLTADM